MRVEFVNRTRKRVATTRLGLYLRIGEKVLHKRLATYCPRGVSLSKLGLIIYFVDDAEIRRLNKEYRGKDKATDVITFSFVEDRNFPPVISGEMFPAGEIFLSLETIARQAMGKGLRFENELVYMLIHGFLHTFGYEHKTDKAEREMELASYGILGKIYPRREEFGF